MGMIVSASETPEDMGAGQGKDCNIKCFTDGGGCRQTQFHPCLAPDPAQLAHLKVWKSISTQPIPQQFPLPFWYLVSAQRLGAQVLYLSIKEPLSGSGGACL